MNNSRWRDPMEGWLNSSRCKLDEQDPVEGWLNSSRWRLDEQDRIDEQ
jgi:hypothetical protein